MDFQVLTGGIAAVGSVIAAISGLVAAVLGWRLLRRQEKADMRKEPIFELHEFYGNQKHDDVVSLRVVARSDEGVSFEVVGVRSNRSVLVPESDVLTRNTPGNTSGGVFSDEYQPSKRCGIHGGFLAKNGDIHYFIPLVISSKRRWFPWTSTHIELIWRWKDEHLERTTRKKITIPTSANT